MNELFLIEYRDIHGVRWAGSHVFPTRKEATKMAAEVLSEEANNPQTANPATHARVLRFVYEPDPAPVLPVLMNPSRN